MQDTDASIMLKQKVKDLENRADPPFLVLI